MSWHSLFFKKKLPPTIGKQQNTIGKKLPLVVIHIIDIPLVSFLASKVM
jgi:hypothetical protein